MPAFFITSRQVSDGTVSIDGLLADHLRASLRLRVGEPVAFTDERGTRYLATVSRLAGDTLEASVGRTLHAPTKTAPSVVLAQSMLKGDRMDWVLQKATELGVAGIVPLVTAHTVVRPREKRVAGQHERLERIVLEAAQQAERWEVPSVAQPIEWPEYLTTSSGAAARLLLCERREGSPITTLPLPDGPTRTIVLAVGPEGGWTPEEVGLALERGFTPVTLGALILRAETAAIAAVSLVQGRLGLLGA